MSLVGGDSPVAEWQAPAALWLGGSPPTQKINKGIVVLFACIGRLIGSGSAVYQGPECLCLHTPYADALSQPPSLHEDVTNNHALLQEDKPNLPLL